MSNHKIQHQHVGLVQCLADYGTERQSHAIHGTTEGRNAPESVQGSWPKSHSETMKRGHLSEYFAGVGVKRLSAVDAEARTSDQHEIGTTDQMRRQFLGTEDKERFKTNYIWLGEDETHDVDAAGATHYRALRHQPDRSPEWRLRYPANRVTEVMHEGDILFLAMTTDRTLYFIVSPDGSTSYRQLSWLFGLAADASPSERGAFVSSKVNTDDRSLDFAARIVLSELGIEFEDPNTSEIDRIADLLGATFPRASVFSQLVRDNLPVMPISA